MVEKNLQNSLGNALRQHRKATHQTQAQIAAQIGTSIDTIRNLERGAGRLTTLQKCLEILQLRLASRSLPAGIFVDNLFALATNRDVSQRTLSRQTMLARDTLINVQRGGGTLGSLLKIAAALNVDVTVEPVDASQSFYTGPAVSSSHHGWRTPLEVLERLYSITGTFDLDPCAPDERKYQIKARAHFRSKQDGLNLQWWGTVFVNPPYGRTIDTSAHVA